MPLYKAGIIDYTWETKPSVAPLGQIICITDIGENGSLWRGNGSKWVRLSQIHFYDLAATVSLTGTTSETTLLTIPIPAGLVGERGILKLYPIWSMTNNSNSKNVKVKLAGQICYSFALVSTLTSAPLVFIRNFNSESAQKTISNSSLGIGSMASALSATTADTGTAIDLVITGQLSSSGDTLTLESLFVEIV